MNKNGIRSLKAVLLATTAVFYLPLSSSLYAGDLVTVNVSTKEQLRDALENAQTNTVRLNQDSTIQLNGKLPVPKGLLGFDGGSYEKDGKVIRPTIDGQKLQSIRLDEEQPDLDFIRNIRFINGNGALEDEQGGGAFYIPGNLHHGIENSEFVNNTADRENQLGGAIYVGQSLSGGIKNSSFKNGKGQWGGGVYVEEDFFGGIINSHFEDNQSKTGGGGIYVKGTLSGGIINSTFKGNIAFEQFDAGIYANNLTGGITDSQFINNMSSYSGAAIFLDGTLEGGIKRGQFFNNANDFQC